MASRNSFAFVGKLTENKDARATINFKNSQWKLLKFNFSLKENGSFHNLTIQSIFQNDNTLLYYFTKNKEKKSVSFKNRNSVNVENVAPYSLCVLDLNKYSKDQLKFFQNNPEKAKEVGLVPERIPEILETYDSRRYKFLSEIDFMDAVEDIIKNPNFKDETFKVSGEVEFNTNQGKTFTTYKVNKVQMVDANPDAITRMNFVFAEDAIDELDDGSFMVNGWTSQYESKEKEDVFYPYAFRVEKIVMNTPEDEARANNFRKRRFTIKGDGLKECNIVTRVINGTEYREITEEDLSEEELDSIFCGETTLEELRREYKPIAGNVIRENRFMKMGIGYSKGPVESSLTLNKIQGIEEQSSSAEDSETLKDMIFDLDQALFGGE